VLRITQEGKADSPSLKLEGRLEGAWVDVLRKAWKEAMGSLRRGEPVVDLGALSFADAAGRALLLEIQREGATLQRVSEFMRHILADMDGEAAEKGE